MRKCSLNELETLLRLGDACNSICWNDPKSKPPKCPVCIALYGKWCQARHRCHTKGYKEYEYYGGRGITVCDEWRNNFKEFRRWAYANGYQQGLELDRRDPDKGYSPENCRFTDGFGQAQNYRKMKTCRGKPTISRFKGVTKRKDGKWRATIQANKKRYNIGVFDTEEEAAKAYDVWAARLHGEFARLNFAELSLVKSTQAG